MGLVLLAAMPIRILTAYNVKSRNINLGSHQKFLTGLDSVSPIDI